MERRDFIRQSCQACLGLMAVSLGLSGCAGVHYAHFQQEKSRLVVKRSEFVQQKKGETRPRAFVFVKPENADFPICVHAVEGGGFVAYLMYCTHQGCELEVHSKRFVCPCHGAEFNLQGEPISGPADENLKTYKITTDDENVYIWLS